MSDMPVSVNELVKSSEGRKHLAKLQEQHKFDILQPGQKDFDRVWGGKVKANKEALEKKERMAKDEWKQSEEKKNWDASKQSDWRTRGRYL